MDASIEAIVDHLVELEAEDTANCEQQAALMEAEHYSVPAFDCGCGN